MHIEILRESLLKPLQTVIGVVERRQTMPVLANVLLLAREGELTLIASDSEVELSARIEAPISEQADLTLPGRKLFDILRALPEGANIHLHSEDGRATLKSGRSRYTLATLPADDFPTVENLPSETELRIPADKLKRLIERTQFAMAQNDVREYLNGLLLELDHSHLRTVATNGHRLAFSEQSLEQDLGEQRQIILPRKAVQEIQRLLSDAEGEVLLSLAAGHIRVRVANVGMTSKLIDARYPDYQRVIPQNNTRVMLADRAGLKAALARAAILCNDKVKGVRLELEDWVLRIRAHNTQQEEAEEEIEVNYSGGPLEIGFNVAYVLDALNALSGDLAKFSLSDHVSSCLISEAESDDSRYVIMPMRL